MQTELPDSSVKPRKMMRLGIPCVAVIFILQVHPNGRLVAFTGRNGASTESEVWVIENLKDELKALLHTQGEKP
jgi:hypothetical protein